MEEGGKLSQLFIDGKLKEIRTPSAIYKTGDNILPLVIEAATATQYSLDLQKVVARGMETCFLEGGCMNKAPQGYRNVRDGIDLRKGHIECDPDRFELIRRAWELILTKGYSVRHVTNTMNSVWGFRTRPTRKGGNRPISYSGLMNIFSNPFYAGFVRRNGKLVKGKHEPMVTLEEFDLAQLIIHRKEYSAPRVREYAYTGFMRCAHCGRQITGELKKLRDGRLWENYHCSDPDQTCTKLGLSLEKVEERIQLHLNTLRIEPELLAAASDNIRRALGKSLPETEAIETSQSAALHRIDERLSRLSEMWLDGVLTDPDQYRQIEQRELKRKQELILQRERMKDERSTMEKNLARATDYLTGIAEKFQRADAWKKKQLCRALAKDWVFDGRTKNISLTIHPLLREFVSYAKEIARLEPAETGSQSQREPHSMNAVLFGGSSSSGLEPRPALIDALREGLFPDVSQETATPIDFNIVRRAQRRQKRRHPRNAASSVA